MLGPSNLYKSKSHEPYYYRIVDNGIPLLNEVKYFTIFDLTKDYFQPLKAIINQSFVEDSSRLQRFLICCLVHEFTIKYIKGKLNALTNCMADFPSELQMRGIDLPNISIKCIIQHVKPSDFQLERAYETSYKDDTTLHFKPMIHNGWPTGVQDWEPGLQPYWNFHERKTIEDGLILKNINIDIHESASWDAREDSWRSP